MNSIKFPNMLSNTYMNVVSNHDATMSNLKLLLMADKYSLFGDPYFGTSLKKLIFEPNNQILKDILIDEIYTTILTFMPQIVVQRKDIEITSNRAEIQANIKCINLLDYQTDLYTISLTQTEEI